MQNKNASHFLLGILMTILSVGIVTHNIKLETAKDITLIYVNALKIVSKR